MEESPSPFKHQCVNILNKRFLQTKIFQLFLKQNHFQSSAFGQLRQRGHSEWQTCRTGLIMIRLIHGRFDLIIRNQLHHISLRLDLVVVWNGAFKIKTYNFFKYASNHKLWLVKISNFQSINSQVINFNCFMTAHPPSPLNA